MPTYTNSTFQKDNYAFNTIAGKDNQLSLQDLKEQMKLIKAEVIELEEAIDNNDTSETLKEMFDVYVTLDGLKQKLELLKFFTDAGAQLVAKNNLSKFVDTKTLADATQMHYGQKGIETTVEYNGAFNKYVVKDKEGKVRKPLGFESVKLDELVPAELQSGFKQRVVH